MSVTAETIVSIAHLARLALDEKAIPHYAEDMNRILHWVEQMNSADTQGIEPMAHPRDLGQRLRPDEVTESDQRECFQANAPQTEAGLYLVPQVIE